MQQATPCGHDRALSLSPVQAIKLCAAYRLYRSADADARFRVRDQRIMCPLPSHALPSAGRHGDMGGGKAHMTTLGSHQQTGHACAVYQTTNNSTSQCLGKYRSLSLSSLQQLSLQSRDKGAQLPRDRDSIPPTTAQHTCSKSSTMSW